MVSDYLGTSEYLQMLKSVQLKLDVTDNCVILRKLVDTWSNYLLFLWYLLTAISLSVFKSSKLITNSLKLSWLGLSFVFSALNLPGAPQFGSLHGGRMADINTSISRSLWEELVALSNTRLPPDRTGCGITSSSEQTEIVQPPCLSHLSLLPQN